MCKSVPVGPLPESSGAPELGYLPRSQVMIRDVVGVDEDSVVSLVDYTKLLAPPDISFSSKSSLPLAYMIIAQIHTLIQLSTFVENVDKPDLPHVILLRCF